MGVCVVGNTIEEARNNVYDLVKQIGLEGKSYNPRIDSW